MTESIQGEGRKEIAHTGRKINRKQSSRSGKFTARKEDVYRVAMDLFRNRGYDKTSVQEIAEASNLQKGSLYHYISSKETLLFDLANRTVNTMVEMIEEVNKEDLPPREKLCRAIEGHLLTGTNLLEEFSVLVQETKYLPLQLKRKVVAKKKQYETALQGIVQAGIREGVFKKLDSKVTTFLLLGALNWLYQWYSPRGPLSPKEISRILCEIVIHGIQKE